MATITNFPLLRDVERLVKAFTRRDNICETRVDASRWILQKYFHKKRSARSMWEFKDTALLGQIAAGDFGPTPSKNIFHSYRSIHVVQRRVREIWKNQGTSRIWGERHEIPISNEWRPTRGLDRPPLHDRGLRLNLEILSSFVRYSRPFHQIETILRSRIRWVL